MTELEDVLEERGKRYGDFYDQAQIAQDIKKAMRLGRNWDELPDFMKEALDMNASKIARILNGDPTYVDSWLDQQGFIQLVLDELG